MPRKAKLSGQRLNRGQMAALLACSPSTLDRYVAAGCPVLSRGTTSRGHEFDTDAVMRWLRGRLDPGAGGGVQNGDAKRRHAMAAAELAELKLAKLRGELVAVEDCLPILREELANLRSRLMAMPGRLAHTLSAMTDPLAVERAIDEEIEAALTEITSAA